MLDFKLDARDGIPARGACDVCCCKNAKATPGEVNKWRLDYAEWALPIGGRGLTARTQISIDKNEDSSGIVEFPNASILLAATTSPTVATLTLSDGINNPDSVALTYSLLDFYPPKYGKVVLNGDGTATYTPFTHAPVYDRFYYQAKAVDGKAIVVEAIIAVSTSTQSIPAATQAMATPIVLIDRNSVKVNPALQAVEFPVVVSPQAAYGDSYRIRVRQQAMDCDHNCFWHESCFDLAIERC